MTIRMTNKVRAAAKSLATTYSAWIDADLETNPNSVVVWGRALLEEQEAMSIELASPDNIKALIVHARVRIAELMNK